MKDDQFPAIRKQAKAEGASIYFADEAGIRSDYHAGTTWAPVGQTPVVKATGARHSLNMRRSLINPGTYLRACCSGSTRAKQRLNRPCSSPRFSCVSVASTMAAAAAS